MKRTRFLSLMLVLVLVIASFAACSSGSPSSQSSDNNSQSSTSDSSNAGTSATSYKIAYMGPITGNQMLYGQIHTAALQIRVDEINEEGGINGVPVEVEIFDDKNDAKETVTVANKIVSDPDILICFGPFSSTNALAAAPIFEKAGVTLYSPSTSHPDFPKQGEYMISGQTVQEYEQSYYAKLAYEVLDCKTAVHYFQNTDSSQTTDKFFTQYYEELGGQVLAHESFVSGSTADHSPVLSKLKELDPDLLYIGAMYNDLATITVQARNLDFDCKIMGSGNNFKQEMIDIAGEAANGMYACQNFNRNSTDPKYVAFAEKYAEMVSPVMDQQAVQMYDMVSMWAEGVRQFGPDKEKVNAYLRNITDYQGINGTVTVIDGTPQKTMFQITVQDGEIVCLGEI